MGQKQNISSAQSKSFIQENGKQLCESGDEKALKNIIRKTPMLRKIKIKIFLDLYRRNRALEKANSSLKITTEDLRQSNKKILKAHKSAIDEERLKILLQLAGATAVEMDDPLNIMLDGLDIFAKRYTMENVEMRKDIEKIMKAGKTLSSIVNKIKNISPAETKSIQKKNPDETDQSINILCVDDDITFLKLISSMLQGYQHIKIFIASRCEETEKLLTDNKYNFDIILLDHNLPDGNSYRIFSFLSQNNIEIPVIIITGQGDEVTAAKVLKLGAVDYFPKMEIHKYHLFDGIKSAIEQHKLKNEIKFVMSEVVEMATKDNLTELYNRRYFYECLESEISRLERYSGDLSICLIDIDNFKFFNDTYGHSAGDLILKDVSKIIINSLRVNDLPCRYGGDEFAIVFPHTSEENAFIICDRIRQSVEDYSFLYKNIKISTSISIGLTGFKNGLYASAFDFIENADRNLYKAKEGGRNRTISTSLENGIPVVLSK